MRKTFTTLFTLIFIISVNIKIQAQTYNEYVKQEQEGIQKMQDDYDKWAKEEAARFNNYVKERDKEFSEYLKKDWEAFKVFSGEKPKVIPGPKKVPSFKPISKKKIPSSIIGVTRPETDMSKRPIIVPTPPVLPDKVVVASSKKSTKGAIPFYGEKIFFAYDKNTMRSIPADKIGPKAIALYWDLTSKTEYFPLVDNLLNYKTQYNLNDWGYYLLVKNVSHNIMTKSKNASNLFTWFLMTKSGYKIKVGYTDKQVFLMLPTNNKLYGMPYFNMNGLNYYVPELNGEQIYTYKEDFPDAKMIMDFNIASPINVSSEISTKKINFEYEDKKYDIKIDFNKSLIDFYNDYPQTEIDVYFNSAVSRYTKESIKNSLEPLVKGKSEIDAVNLLLHFVQTSFDYKTDQDQFGKEKFYFAEELFYYKFSDCEDRAVLFSYLVKELLSLKVVGLDYPGHIATAVKFSDKIEGDNFTYKNETFTVCDPTYINAPAGLTMPDFVNTKPEIVEINNIQNNENNNRKLWEKVYAMGGNRGDNGKDIITDKNGNSYLTGFFTGEVSFGKYKLSTKNENDKDIFVMKINNKGEVEWVKRTEGGGNEMAYGINLDKLNNIFITGSFDKNIKFGNKELKANGNPEVFLAKYNNSGNLIWTNKLGLDTLNKLNPNKIFLATIDKNGKLKSTKFFSETEYFDEFGISISENGEASVSGSFSSTLAMNVKDKSFNSSTSFSLADSWQMKTTELVKGNYNSEIVGLFTFIHSIRSVGMKISGDEMQKAIKKNNPNFPIASPTVFENIGNLNVVKNSSGIISIKTNDGSSVNFNTLKINDNAKIRFISYKNGNSRINVLTGLKIGKGFAKYDLNYIKINKDNGDMLFDYDNDHTQKKLNMKKDILD